MGWPPLWGYLFWALLHAIARAFANLGNEPIPAELGAALLRFLTRLCRYLPCPACRGHCAVYVQTMPGDALADGERIWKAFVDFHNSVNARTNKVLVTYEEAAEVLKAQLAEFGGTPEKIHDMFLQDWWNVLLMTAFAFAVNPDTPKDQEQKDYLEFLRDACTIMPFSFRKLPSGTVRSIGTAGTVREKLLDFCDSPSMDLKSRNSAFNSILGLHNSVCAEFGIIPKTSDEMMTTFRQKLEGKNATELIRANQIHEEDQKKMLALQTEINALRSGKNGSAAVVVQSDECASYQSATIALAVLLGSVLVVLFSAYITYRYKLLGEWRLVKHNDHSVSRKKTMAGSDVE